MVIRCRYTYRSKVPKNRKWFDDVLPQLDDYRFKTYLRVTREQFNIVLMLIRNHKNFHGYNSAKQFPVSTQLALVLYRLGSNGDGASVAKMAALFGIGDGGTMDKITLRIFRVSRLNLSYYAIIINITLMWFLVLEILKIIYLNFRLFYHCISSLCSGQMLFRETQ